MRAECKVAAALSLFLLISACGKHDEPTARMPADLAKDLAVASAPGLAVAPQSYTRMRFVSDVEQSRATDRAPKPKAAHQHHLAATETPAPNAATIEAAVAVAAMESAAPAPVLTAASPVAEQPVMVAARPAPEPQSGHGGGGPSAEGDVLDHGGSGGGLVGILGGIAGTAVLRGGRVRDKCDPRTDGRMRPDSRPDFSMPSPVGRPIFGSSGRR